MSGTSLDAALSALVATYTAGMPSGWSVIDGQPYDPPERFLAVGWDRSGQPVAHAARVLTSAAGTQQSEATAVTCLLSGFAGDELTPGVRGEVCAAFDTFDAALAADLQLGGAVMLARVAEFQYVPYFSAEGAYAEIRFTVALQAWR